MNTIMIKSRKIVFSSRLIALIGTTVILAACGEKPQPSKPPMPQTKPMFQEQRDALGKARDVGQGMAKGAEELKQETEKQAQ